jgi:hypothetical protein
MGVVGLQLYLGLMFVHLAYVGLLGVLWIEVNTARVAQHYSVRGVNNSFLRQPVTSKCSVLEIAYLMPDLLT